MKKDVLRIILDLKGRGRSRKEIKKFLDDRGVVNRDGNPYTVQAVGMAIKRENDRLAELSLKPGNTEESENMPLEPPVILDLLPETSESFANPDTMPEFSEVSVTTDTPMMWSRAEIVEMIREALREQTGELMKTQKVQNTDLPQKKGDALTDKLPPVREKIMGGKKRKVGVGSKAKVYGMVDSELFRHLEEWRKPKTMTLSAALDAVLWTFFNEPDLSFEKTEKPE